MISRAAHISECMLFGDGPAAARSTKEKAWTSHGGRSTPLLRSSPLRPQRRQHPLLPPANSSPTSGEPSGHRQAIPARPMADGTSLPVSSSGRRPHRPLLLWLATSPSSPPLAGVPNLLLTGGKEESPGDLIGEENGLVLIEEEGSNQGLGSIHSRSNGQDQIQPDQNSTAHLTPDLRTIQ